MFGSPERKRTKQGESDGRYNGGKKHGETTSMQPAWLVQKDGPPKYTLKGMPVDREQPARSKWLQDGGLGEDIISLPSSHWEVARCLPQAWALRS